MCAVVRWVHISTCFWEKWMSSSQSQRPKGPSRLSSATDAKASVCRGKVVQQSQQHGDWHMCESTIYRDCTETYAAIKMTRFMGRPWLDQDNARYHSAYATTVWFRRDRVNVLDRLVCSIKQWSSVNVLWCVTSVSYWKCMAHHEKENQTTTLTDCWASEVLNQARLDKDFACKTLTISIFNFQTTNIAIMRMRHMPLC